MQLLNEDKMIGALRKIEDEKSDNESDAEINSMILNDEERKLKTLLWNNLNKQYLEEQHKKKKDKKVKNHKTLKVNIEASKISYLIYIEKPTFA